MFTDDVVICVAPQFGGAIVIGLMPCGVLFVTVTTSESPGATRSVGFCMPPGVMKQ